MVDPATGTIGDEGETNWCFISSCGENLHKVTRLLRSMVTWEGNMKYEFVPLAIL
jgi:hypothetical protein